MSIPLKPQFGPTRTKCLIDRNWEAATILCCRVGSQECHSRIHSPVRVEGSFCRSCGLSDGSDFSLTTRSSLRQATLAPGILCRESVPICLEHEAWAPFAVQVRTVHLSVIDATDETVLMDNLISVFPTFVPRLWVKRDPVSPPPQTYTLYRTESAWRPEFYRSYSGLFKAGRDTSP